MKKNLIKKEIVFKKNIKFKIKRKVYENYVKKSISFTDKNKQYNFNEKVNNLSLKNFKNYLSNTNLEILEFFGDYDLNPFDNIKSPRLIIILKKKSQSNKWLGFEEGGDILSHQMAVPSALLGLTSLFEMGRGEPQCYNHP